MVIVCNGMARSGSTLQYNLVRSLVEKTGLGRGEGYFGADKFTDLMRMFENWGKDGYMHVIKMHDVHPYTEAMVSAGLMRVCYIYRDIRDVAVSVRRKFKPQGEDLFKLLDDAISAYYEIKKINSALLQRYEEVLIDHVKAVREIADFLGVNAKEDVVAYVAAECDVSTARMRAAGAGYGGLFLFRSLILRVTRRVNVKRLLRGLGVPESAGIRGENLVVNYDRQTLLHPDHISEDSGASGVWRTVLGKEEVEAILKRYSGWLRDAGYSV